MAEIAAAYSPGFQHRLPLVLGEGRSLQHLKMTTTRWRKRRKEITGTRASTDIVTFSSNISTDLLLYESPGVSFDEYLHDRPRIFQAMFPDQRRSKRLNDEEWRVQMLPIRILFLTAHPVVVMRLRCKSQGEEYPPAVPRHITSVLELRATKWELHGLERSVTPSDFVLSVEGALYPERRGGRSRLKGHLEMRVGCILPPMLLALVPENILRGIAESVLTRLAEKMKQDVDASLLTDFRNFQKEKLTKNAIR
ncbi:uncharacterized protein [Typha angustifolia]|uniref:uncharacterized protein isoform X2 n=1 Tax=Typha angustifolia TaxID=59011 RepID=UPI003C2CE5C7